MADLTFGEVDWNNGDAGNTGGDRPEVPFLRLSQGKNKVRIMSNPLQTYIHWVENTEGKRRPFGSPIEDPALVQQLEDAGFARKRSWYLKVLDRMDGEFKVLQIGPQIYNGIKGLYNDEDWGPVTKYDITINRGPKGSQPLYSVLPSNKNPLEDNFVGSWEAFEEVYGDLSRLTQPAKPERVREFMGWEEGAKVTTASHDEFESGSGSNTGNSFGSEKTVKFKF